MFKDGLNNNQCNTLNEAAKTSSRLLRCIKNLQSRGDSIYPRGLFPSQRFHTHLACYHREDSNLFFTTIIIFTLQQLQGSCREDAQEIIRGIVRKAQSTYGLYQNKDGAKTYNFWQTRPSRHFPNGYILRRCGFLQLPDDVDDTALVYLTSQPAPGEVLWLKHKLVLHANLYEKQIKNTLPKYRRLKAYSTWFGKDMYLEFDFCVLCNLMYLIFTHKLPLNEHDRDSLLFLRSVILSGEHFTHTFQVAPSYPKTSLILYHISRLISAFDVPGLTEARPKIIDDIHKTLSHRLHPAEKILLSSSLMKLGEKPLNIQISDPRDYFKGFYFFNGGMLTAFEHPLCRRLARYDFFHLKHRCQAYNYTLLLEHEVLKSQIDRL